MSYFDDVFESSLCYGHESLSNHRNDYGRYICECASYGIWPTSHGEVEIASMSDDYISNCLALMKRKHKTEMLRLFGPIFEAELERRQNLESHSRCSKNSLV